ncbi:hypothetical protein FKM82_017968 [Ascaphus truei]
MLLPACIPWESRIQPCVYCDGLINICIQENIANGCTLAKLKEHVLPKKTSPTQVGSRGSPDLNHVSSSSGEPLLPERDLHRGHR